MSKVNRLQEIRGIGPSVEEKLINVFRTETAVLELLRSSRIAELASIEGIGEKFALTLCRNLHFQETGERLDNFLKTEDAKLIYSRIIDIISQYSNTLYSRSKMYLYFPLPISSIEKIKLRQKRALLGKQLVNLIKKSAHSLDDYNKQLKNLSPLKVQGKSLDTASRTIVTTDKHFYKKLGESEIADYCELLFLENLEEISLLAEYDEVLWVGSDIMLDESLPNVYLVPESQKNDINQLLPEKTLMFFARNKVCLKSISNLALLLQTLPPLDLPLLIGELDLSKVREMGELIDKINDSGEPSEMLNAEYTRLVYAEENFDEKLSERLLALNEELEKMLQETTVHLGGEKIIALLKGMADDDLAYSSGSRSSELRDYLDEELFLTVEELITQAENKLITELNLKHEETDYINGIFPRELRYPIDSIDETVNRVTNFLRRKRAITAFELKVGLAQSLTPFIDLAKNALHHMFEIDYLLMLGKFSVDYDMVLPQFISNSGTGVVIDEGRNLFLAYQSRREEFTLEPVSYAAGEVGKIDGVVKGERIILLSGANSGGKTTLLNSIGIMVILAQMGLPVPAKKVIIGGFMEFHYYRKSSGQMNAGAFESTLRTLSNMILSPESRLVLADEMESISEPGASARVIAAFLDLLSRDPNSLGIFVTHLAQLIAEYTKESIRIDGIEAKGLSEELELIVNRTPVYYKYAKSTPELIVRRLKHISKGKEQEIYSYILDAFND